MLIKSKKIILNRKQLYFQLINIKEILVFSTTIFFLIFLGCNKDIIPVEPVNESTFDIFFLKDSTLKIKDIYNKDIDSLQLADNPWITSDDFYMYDFSSHCMYLKRSKENFLLNYDTVYIPPPSWTDKPFIVVVDKRPCYAGYIMNPVIYNKWLFATINTDIGFYPEDILYINWMWLFRQDIRNNDSVKKVFQDKGLYHGGISVEFDSISIFNTTDTASIRYSIWIKNNDNENLYVLDPDKCGDSVFNCYQVSPTFLNIETHKVYYPDYFNPQMGIGFLNDWKPEWFTLLEPGAAINRKVFLKAYDKFEDGNYIFQMGFCSPLGISKEKRNKGNGRYWLGKSKSDVFSFTYKSNEIVARLNKIKSNYILIDVNHSDYNYPVDIITK